MIVALILLVTFIAAGLIAAAWVEAAVIETLESTAPVTVEEPITEESLTDADFAEAVRAAYEEGDVSYADLAEEFSTSKSTIGRIIRHEWRA